MTKKDQKIIIESLAMDLKRVALGLQRGSNAMAQRFTEEALKRESELEQNNVQGYLEKLIVNSKKALLSNDVHAGEDILMYSTLFQNFSQKIL